MKTLSEKLHNPSNHYLYVDGFIEFLEMNLADLRAASVANAREITISDVDKHRANRNFNLLCNIANIPYDLHWLTMRVNGYKEFTEYNEHDGPLYHVDGEYLALLRLKYDESQTNI